MLNKTTDFQRDEVLRLRVRASSAEAINERLRASIRLAFEELGDNDDAGAYLTLKHSGALCGGPTVVDTPEMVLVPREPTAEMIRAAHWALYHWREASGNPQREASRDEKHAIRWRAMLEAANDK